MELATVRGASACCAQRRRTPSRIAGCHRMSPSSPSPLPYPCKFLQRSCYRSSDKLPTAAGSATCESCDTSGRLLSRPTALANCSGVRSLAATGTAGSATAVGAAVGMRKSPPDRAKECVGVRTEASGEEESGDCKPLQIADLCEVAREDAAGNESASCRARTYDPLIKSQQTDRFVFDSIPCRSQPYGVWDEFLRRILFLHFTQDFNGFQRNLWHCQSYLLAFLPE